MISKCRAHRNVQPMIHVGDKAILSRYLIDGLNCLERPPRGLDVLPTLAYRNGTTNATKENRYAQTHRCRS